MLNKQVKTSDIHEDLNICNQLFSESKQEFLVEKMTLDRSYKKKMDSDDERKIMVLKSQLVSVPLKDKQKILDQIKAIAAKYESVLNHKAKDRGLRFKLSEGKVKKELSSYIEINDNGKITRMEPEAFRKAIGGARTGFAQDWVDQYNKDKGSKMARLVLTKNGKEIGKIDEGFDSPTRKMIISTDHGQANEVIRIVKDFKKKYPAEVDKITKMPKAIVVQFSFSSVADSLLPMRNLKDSLAEIGVDRSFYKIESKLQEGGKPLNLPKRGDIVVAGSDIGIVASVQGINKWIVEFSNGDRRVFNRDEFDKPYAPKANEYDAVKKSKYFNRISLGGKGRPDAWKVKSQTESKLNEGGPGSGLSGVALRNLRMPLSPFISVGTRKGILQNMPFETEEVPLSAITHVAQRRYVPSKVSKLCKNASVVTKMPVCLLKIPSENSYHVMDGHHRFLAAQKLGLETIPAKVWVKFEEPIETAPEPEIAIEQEPLEPIETKPEAEASPESNVTPMAPEGTPIDEPAPVVASEPINDPAILSEPVSDSQPSQDVSIVDTEPKDPEASASTDVEITVPTESHAHYQVVCEKCDKVTESCGCVNEAFEVTKKVCESCKANSFVPTLEQALRSLQYSQKKLSYLI